MLAECVLIYSAHPGSPIPACTSLFGHASRFLRGTMAYQLLICCKVEFSQGQILCFQARGVALDLTDLEFSPTLPTTQINDGASAKTCFSGGSRIDSEPPDFTKHSFRFACLVGAKLGHSGVKLCGSQPHRKTMSQKRRVYKWKISFADQPLP